MKPEINCTEAWLPLWHVFVILIVAYDFNGFPLCGTVAPLTLHALLIDQTELQGNVVLKVHEQSLSTSSCLQFTAFYFGCDDVQKSYMWIFFFFLSFLQKENKPKATPTHVFVYVHVISPHPRASVLSDNAQLQ